MEADKDRDGKISFEEFTKMVENTDVSMSMTLGKFDFNKPCPIDGALPYLINSDGNFGIKLLIDALDQF